MKIEEQEIADCFLVTGKRFPDDRGFLQELYSNRNPVKADGDHWQQVNWSVSKRDVVRGIHLAPYAKLVTCLTGRVFDVVVDLRPNSSTFKKWLGWWLDADEPTQIYVPPMCGHGFYSAEDNSTVVYLQEAIWHPSIEQIVHWEDHTINIRWPKPTNKYILSEKDRNGQPYDIISRANHTREVHK